jgi:forespore regulator of the sigma-K checkpoint
MQVVVFKFLKQLRKKLRWKRRWIALGSLLLCIGGTLYSAKLDNSSPHAFAGIGKAVQSAFSHTAETGEPDRSQAVMDTLKQIKDKREVFVQRIYVCGEELQKLGQLTADDMLKEYMEHPDWQLTLKEDGSVRFKQQIEDLSPECKSNAYFGIDASGNLSLFNGLPGKENVIRTFFQLNIHHLESSLPRETVKQLYQGIRVSDLAEYNSVLSTFSDYAVEEIEKAMSPQ